MIIEALSEGVTIPPEPITYNHNYLNGKSILNFVESTTITNSSSAITIDMKDSQYTIELRNDGYLEDDGVEIIIANFTDGISVVLPDIFLSIHYEFFGSYFERYYDGTPCRYPTNAVFEFAIITEPFSQNIADTSGIVKAGVANEDGLLYYRKYSPFGQKSTAPKIILEPLKKSYGLYIKRSSVGTVGSREVNEFDYINIQGIQDF